MKKQTIAIIGASGGIGSSLVSSLAKIPGNAIFAFSRSGLTTGYPNVRTGYIDINEEESIEKAATNCSQDGPIDLIIVSTGLLHDKTMQPEKSLGDLDINNLQKIFSVNTIGPAMVAKHFLPILNKQHPSVFAALTARVGSISDNRLGGWYAYRASKSALNMIIKTASLEMARRNPKAIVAGLHPGTVATMLSEPFQKRVPQNKLFSTDYSAQQLINTIQALSRQDSGKVFAWDGNEIPY